MEPAAGLEFEFRALERFAKPLKVFFFLADEAPVEFLRVVDVDHLDAIISYHPLKVTIYTAMEQFKNVGILKESGTEDFYKGVCDFISEHVNNVGLDFSCVEVVGGQLDEADVAAVALCLVILNIDAYDFKFTQLLSS